MSIIYPNGAGDTLGDQLVTCKPLYSSGSIWYVNSNGGVDGASQAGKNREKPLATLAQALTNSADNDIIELMSGHVETSPGPWTVAKKVIIVGGGSAGGKPTVKLNGSGAGTGVRINITVDNVEIRNIWFPAATGALAASISVVIGGLLSRVKNCYFELGASDTSGIRYAAAANTGRIVNTTFISVATLVTQQPTDAVEFLGAVNDLELDGVVFNSGTVGFSSPQAFNVAGNQLLRLKAENVSLLQGADWTSAIAGTTGFLNPQISTGGSRVDF